MDIAVAAWAAASLLSALAAGLPRLGLLGEIEQREGLLTTLALAGLYAGTRRSHLDAGHARATLSVILACGALAAGYALIQITGLDPLAWANAPTYPAEGGARVLRAFATLGNPILLGNLLAAALAIGVARLACGRGPVWRLAPAVALIAGAIVATLSRGAWLAAAAGVTAALAAGLARGAARAARRLGLALAVATPLAVWLAIALRAPVAARLAEATGAHAESGAARVEIARGALALLRAHPWLGAGPDSFGLMFPGVQSAALWRTEWLGIPVHAHSVALQVLATLGAAGALAGLAWLAALARALAVPGLREEDGEGVALGAAALALAVAGAVNPVGLAGAACFAVLSALAAGRSEPPPGGAHVEAASGPRAPLIAPLAVGLVTALVVAIAGAREMTALAAAGRARTALERTILAPPDERGRLSESAARVAERAAALAPGEDELWRLACDAGLARAEAALARRDLTPAAGAAAGAENAARRALRLLPLRASNHERLANALMMRARLALVAGPGAPPSGDAASALADSADAAFAEAERLAPADALILTEQARGQLLLRRPERALGAARRIAALYPEAAIGHALEAAALLSLGRAGEAREALLRARDARWEEGSEPQRRMVGDLLRAIDRPDTAR